MTGWEEKGNSLKQKGTKEGNGEMNLIKIIMYENVIMKSMYMGVCVYIYIIIIIKIYNFKKKLRQRHNVTCSRSSNL